MSGPTTYAEWVKCFDVLKLGSNDDETIFIMEQGAISWTSGVAERFASELFDVINYRINDAAKKFQRSLDGARGNEVVIVNALLSVRKELSFLKRLTNLPAIPPDKKEHFTQQILEYANNTQQSLEKSALADRTGRLGSLVKNNRIDRF
jgi:hypothetical protein